MKRNALKLLAILMVGGTLFISGCTADMNAAGTIKDAVSKSGSTAKEVIGKYKDGEYDEQIEEVKSKLQDVGDLIKTPSKAGE